VKEGCSLWWKCMLTRCRMVLSFVHDCDANRRHAMAGEGRL
jgi:hypothetical protein